MGKRKKMPVSTKKSLEVEMEREIEDAAQHPDNKSPYCAGSVEEFDEEELLNPPKRCKLFVSFGHVFLMGNESPTHLTAQTVLTKSIADGINSHFGKNIVMYTAGLGQQVSNFNECGFEFIKKPDGDIVTREYWFDTPPLLVSEVAYTHESLDLLLREGEVYLNQYTHIRYAVLLNIVSQNEVIQSVRFILCARLEPEELAKAQAIFSDQRKNDCKKKFGNHRLRYGQLKQLNLQEIEQWYNFRIVADHTVYRNDIHEVSFQLSASLLFQYTPYEGIYTDEFTVTISSQDVTRIFNAPPNPRRRH